MSTLAPSAPAESPARGSGLPAGTSASDGALARLGDGVRADWFAAMVESAPIAMALVDREGIIVHTNPQTDDLFGYARGELLGSPVEQVIPARYRMGHLQMREAYQARPAARPMGLGRTVMGLRKDGQEVELDVSLSPILCDEAEDRILVIAVDVTQQRERERERERSASELARINRALDEFAFVASHDLQEPLRKIACCCEVIKEDYADKLDAAGREWLGYAIDGARRIQAMVGDLLEFSRIRREEDSLGPTDAGVACAAAIENLQVAMEEAGARITVQPLPWVRGSRMLLVQVFQNLIGNAIKYRGPRPPEIVVGAEPVGSHWRLFVRDNGIGIAAQHHDRIFTIFQRLHNREEYGGGTGIGLAIVKKIIDQLCGAIWIESQPGQGSTFYFSVPAAEPSSGSDPDIEDVAVASAGR